MGNEAGKLLAFRDLVRKGLTPPVLVFVQSKERAQQLFNELIYDGINVDAIHADRTQLQVTANVATMFLKYQSAFCREITLCEALERGEFGF